jgi:hypothetical protein
MYNYAYHRMTSLQYGEMDKGKETKNNLVNIAKGETYQKLLW